MVRSHCETKRNSLELFARGVAYYISFIVPGIDDGDEAISSYVLEEDEDVEDMQYRELDTERLAFEASETDTMGITMAAADRLKANSVADKNDKDATGNSYLDYELTINSLLPKLLEISEKSSNTHI